MADTQAALTTVPDTPAMPTEITLDPQNPVPPHNARDVGLLKAMTGRSFTELMGPEGRRRGPDERYRLAHPAAPGVYADAR